MTWRLALAASISFSCNRPSAALNSLISGRDHDHFHNSD
jgi:hypothetical protein